MVIHPDVRGVHPGGLGVSWLLWLFPCDRAVMNKGTGLHHDQDQEVEFDAGG